MKFRLKKDIVIPAGMIFETAPKKTERFDDSMVGVDFGLTKDTSGYLTYGVDRDDPAVGEWFEEVK
ncbi:MAG: hypothetical protein EOM02_06090 [Synergistales bacterium]|nr:hypothetical protein [Synergistales bacterium]